MSYRFMRILLFFDLPVGSIEERREYTRFRQYLIKSGFMMMQESVYSKLALNTTAAEAVIANVRKNKPTHGLVEVLNITEKQFSKMEIIIGTKSSEVLDNDERLIIL
ncbi:MAG: cas2 [Firmicutes bacterium]|nr:cas2 [Bacillota bacterium]